jgi:hypothetical protein
MCEIKTNVSEDNDEVERDNVTKLERDVWNKETCSRKQFQMKLLIELERDDVEILSFCLYRSAQILPFSPPTLQSPLCNVFVVVYTISTD